LIVIELGIMVSDNSGCGDCVRVTVTAAVLDTTEPSGFLSSAVMLVDPTLTPFTRPLPEGCPEVIVAIDGILEAHWICEEFVTSCCRPVPPIVASAINCPVWPEAETLWEPGIIVTAVNCCVVPLLTVNVAFPVMVLPPLELV
jgi:hypothetical protein